MQFLDECHVQIYHQRTRILTEGLKPESVYMVAHGTIDIFNESPLGHRVLLHRAGQGEIVGDIEMLAEEPCVATCETSETATLLICSRKQFLTAIAADKQFLRNLMKIISLRLDRSNQFKVVDRCYPIEQRLCSYLQYLSLRTPVITENQHFLAELIGCSRQTINRELRALRDLGVISTQNSRIEVLDPERLADLAQSRLPD
ncbi:Crp/Fnr family transcriptional regulator [Algicella marina]|nr:Crp/Fnr family transcriptional regulator [Algicella marina]